MFLYDLCFKCMRILEGNKFIINVIIFFLFFFSFIYERVLDALMPFYIYGQQLQGNIMLLYALYLYIFCGTRSMHGIGCATSAIKKNNNNLHHHHHHLNYINICEGRLSPRVF